MYLNLFYSNITAEDQPQNDALYSLGGYCSSSQVPSGENGTIFSTISEYTIDQNRPQYICLVLKNTFTEEISNIAIYFEKDPEQVYQCKYRIAFSPPVDRKFENVPTIHSRPVYPVFDTADGEENMIFLPDMRPGDILGVWIERTIDQDSVEIKCRNDNQFLYNEYIKRTRPNPSFNNALPQPNCPPCMMEKVEGSNAFAKEESLDLRILWGDHEGRDLFRVGFLRPNDLLTFPSFIKR